MKNLGIVLVFVFLASFITSCASSSGTKRCRGNGSWYGNRNLSKIDKTFNESAKTYFVFKQTEEAQS